MSSSASLSLVRKIAADRVDGAGGLVTPLNLDRHANRRLDRTAALFGFNTEALYDFVKPGGTSPGFDRTNGGLIVFPGGVPVKNASGKLIGAVGVSGGMVDQDYEVATAAVAALN